MESPPKNNSGFSRPSLRLVRADEPPETTAADTESVTAKRDDIVGKIIAEMNEQYAVARVGSRVCILSVREVYNPNGNTIEVEYMQPRDLELLHANQRVKVPEVIDGNVKWKMVNPVSLWLTHKDRRTVNHLTFAPGITADDLPEGVYNLWRGWGCTPAVPLDGMEPADACPLILRHLHEVWCSGDDNAYTRILAYLADIVQHPTDKPGTALVIKSPEGTGKSIVINEYLRPILGQALVHVKNRRYITSNFNSVLQGGLLVVAEEAVWGGDKQAEGVLKTLITEPTITIEQKHKEPYELPNYARFIFFSNEDWVIPAGPSARRYHMLEASAHRKGDTEYFAALAEEAANGGAEAFFHYLLTLDLPSLAVNLREGYHTAALATQKLASADVVTRWWHECLYFGNVSGAEEHGSSDAHGWQERISSDSLFASFDKFCSRTKISHPPTHPQVSAKLAEMLGVSELKKVRPRGGESRLRFTVLPPLDEARAQYETYMHGAISWPLDEEEEDC